MAFYTSRVDDDGNELERRPSARNLTSSITDSTAKSNLSSRSCEIKGNVRYVNPAAYIEKSGETERTLGAGQKSVRSKGRASSETESDIVPPLDLQSEDNYPTTQDCTFSYRKYCEPAKIVLKPNSAYETWLSAKKKLLTDAAAKKKKAEQQKKREIEERKRLAEEKFQKWLETKARQSKSQPPQHSSMQQISSKQTIKSSSTRSEVFEKPSRSQLSKEESKARLVEWEKSKRAQEERRRIIKRQEEEKRREIEEQRRHMAADAWEKWLSEAAKKPKPVPLNRGIFTLRATISNIYVNPNAWQPIIPIKEED
ncbi:coiled-coil domain-containing protein 34-like [Glossina fuscipes]|uniref:Coiled-coil domain-containing protein 34-like n=1 Tax=Glossina fuscipes TaxID=7396 RepID=A0A9C6E3J7_9MUSC|nr:coiled-coil domain-containing protein 34-like [Glossina fuscipes]